MHVYGWTPGEASVTPQGGERRRRARLGLRRRRSQPPVVRRERARVPGL